MVIIGYIFQCFGMLAFVYIIVTQGKKLLSNLAPFLTINSRVTNLDSKIIAIEAHIEDLRSRHNLDKKVMK